MTKGFGLGSSDGWVPYNSIYRDASYGAHNYIDLFVLGYEACIVGCLTIFDKFPFFSINRSTLTALHTILLRLGFNGESQYLRASLAERLVKKIAVKMSVNHFP